LKREELSGTWDPETDKSFTVWEATQHLLRAFNEGGEESASLILAGLTDLQTESARALCYRLYNTCDRKGWAEEAVLYNAMISSLSEVTELAKSAPREPEQYELT
jgi:putative DNA methylase